MPLEIRELIIRVTVNENNQGQVDDAQLAKKMKEMESRIIDKCLEQVSEQLEKMDER